jgi:serine/threonine protein kinase
MTSEKQNNGDGNQDTGQAIYNRAKEVFLRLVDLPVARREILLTEISWEDQRVAEMVQELLNQHDTLQLQEEELQAQGGELPARLGPFVPTRLLGEGGTGAVYLAHRESDGQEVALKVLHPGMLARESRLRFNRESKILSRLEHPGIPRLLATGEEETPHGTVYFFATEYLDGMRLDSLQKADLSREARLVLMLHICEAVAHAHRAGVVHRDLKPANILVAADGRPRILDFGVSNIRGATVTEVTDVSAVTETGQLVGTLKYMSPEQVRGHEVGPHTDVYALGLVLHQVLTGEMPYEVPPTPIHQSLAAVLTAEPVPLTDRDPSLDPALEAIAACCLARDPAARYPSAAELAADLKAHLEGRPVAAATTPGLSGRPWGIRRWVLVAIFLAIVLTLFFWRPWEGNSRRDDPDLEGVAQDPIQVDQGSSGA